MSSGGRRLGIRAAACASRGHRARPPVRIPGRPSYLGKTAHYNDIATWAYADLPPGHHGLVVRRQDRRRLHKALGAPNESLILIESIMDPYDAPAAVINCSKR